MIACSHIMELKYRESEMLEAGDACMSGWKRIVIASAFAGEQ